MNPLYVFITCVGLIIFIAAGSIASFIDSRRKKSMREYEEKKEANNVIYIKRHQKP